MKDKDATADDFAVAEAHKRRGKALAARPDVAALIGAEWRPELGGEEITHVDPATGTPTATFRGAGAHDVADAVAAARDGLETWRHIPPTERAAIIRALGAAITAQADELALLTTLETGTPIVVSGARMPTVPQSWFDYYAGWCDKLTGETAPASDGPLQYTVHEPVGVVVKLVTWNSPIGGMQMAVPAALAAGCSVIIRPPELAPFSLTKFGQIVCDVGVPPGVIGILPAGPSGAEALVRHPDVAKVSFTGGPRVARDIQRAAAETLTPLVFELGGKSANVVFEDADVADVVRHASIACMLSGQGCALPTRLIVHDSLHDEVLDRVVAAMSQFTVGDPFESSTLMGPVISVNARDRVNHMIKRAVADGARLALGGEQTAVPDDGFFVPPTVLADVDVNSEIAQHEVFGPVLSVLPFSTEDQAVDIANATSLGLVAYVHTPDITRALRLSRRLIAGSVSINGAPTPSGPHVPYGGVKDSGFGREGGREGVLEFTSTKTVSITT